MSSLASDRVLVTGVSGFIAGEVALALIRRGYRVRGTVRSAAKGAAVVEAVQAAGMDPAGLELAEADLTRDDGWDEAASGCRYVLHTASPFPMAQPRNKFALVEAARGGALRVIGAASRAGVRRVVLTSSVVAVYQGHGQDRDPHFSEADFSNVDGPSIQAYAVSKTLAEQAAWDAVSGSGLELSTINPALVLGPIAYGEPGTSIAVLRMMMKGRMPVVPDVAFGIVDVRDVAEAHVRAMEVEAAEGRRFLLSGGTRSLMEIGEAIAAGFPAYRRRMPKAVLPGAVVRAAAWLLPQARSLVEEAGRRKSFDTRPAEQILGLSFRSPEEAVRASAESLIARGMV